MLNVFTAKKIKQRGTRKFSEMIHLIPCVVVMVSQVYAHISRIIKCKCQINATFIYEVYLNKLEFITVVIKCGIY